MCARAGSAIGLKAESQPNGTRLSGVTASICECLLITICCSRPPLAPRLTDTELPFCIKGAGIAVTTPAIRLLATIAVTVCLKGIEQNMTYSLGEISRTWKGRCSTTRLRPRSRRWAPRDLNGGLLACPLLIPVSVFWSVSETSAAIGDRSIAPR